MTPRVIVVGAAPRDLVPDDPRGWRLGGAVTYGALTLARLGLAVRAVVGVDAAAAEAAELDLLAEAGVALERVLLATGPVFENRETAAGRVQRCLSVASPLPVDTLRDSAMVGEAVLFGPVAAELADDWAARAPEDALVALGLQGLVRELRRGAVVRPTPPRPSALLWRANLIGLSREDLPAGSNAAAVFRHAAPGATVLITAAEAGGEAIVAPRSLAEPIRTRRYRAVTANRVVDPTGAGDVFLAAVLACRLVPGLSGGGGGAREARELRFAAATASLSVEAPGLLGVPDLAAVRRRIARARSRPSRVTSVLSSRGKGRPSPA